MRSIAIILLLGMLISCETDPQIYDPIKPIPIVYALFDDHATTHYVVVTKSFGAEVSPQYEGKIKDSLYFDTLAIEIGLKEWFTREWIWITPEKVVGNKKDSGLFLHPYQEYYKFDAVIRDTPAHWDIRTTYSIDSIILRINIPGYDEIFCKHNRIDSIRIWSPKYDQQYLFLTPKASLLFQWDYDPFFGPVQPHAWTEIDVQFEIIERLAGATRSKWVVLQNTLTYQPHSKYQEMNVTYEEFIREVLLQIPKNPDVEQRKFGEVKMHIVGGDEPMQQYMKFFDGHSDYNRTLYSNIENAMGFLGTYTQVTKEGMRFDWETERGLYEEVRLRALKFAR